MNQQSVREALQRCLDGAAVVRAFGGPALASASHQVLVPGSWGYQPQNLYRAGQPGGTAGVPDGSGVGRASPHLSLTYLAVGRGRDPAVVGAITEGLARAGISLRVVDGGGDEGALTDGQTHWDVALLLTTPDWPSENARSYVVPRSIAAGARQRRRLRERGRAARPRVCGRSHRRHRGGAPLGRSGHDDHAEPAVRPAGTIAGEPAAADPHRRLELPTDVG